MIRVLLSISTDTYTEHHTCMTHLAAWLDAETNVIDLLPPSPSVSLHMRRAAACYATL